MIDLPPPEVHMLPGHLKLFHGVYVDDVVKTLAKRKGESAAAFRARRKQRKDWEADELRQAHAWAHGNTGRMAIPHRHVITK